MRLDTSLAEFFNTADVIDGQVEKTQTLDEDHTRYHRAAIDGYVDMLCEISKRDANFPSKCNEFTPTLLAAYHGHLEALRMLVGRGGDPEKSAADGFNALHFAASRNHLNCVSFLVNFGVNMWALDNELHTAKDVAAMLQRKEVLDYLDQMMAKQSALNTKNVQKLKEKAKLAAERRLKKVRKAQLRAIKLVEKDERYLAKLSNSRRLLKSAHSISDIELVERSTTPSVSSCLRLQVQSGDQQKQQQQQQQQTSGLRGCIPASTASRLSNSSSLANLIRSNLLGRAKQLNLRKQVPTCGDAANNKSFSSCSPSSISSSSCNLSSTSSSSQTSQIDAHKSLISKRGLIDVKKQLDKPPGAIRNEANKVSRKLQLRRKNLSSKDAANYHHEDRNTTVTADNKSLECDTGLSSEEQSMIIKPASLSSNQLIKWPPAPVLSRAISEPDFGQTIRVSEDVVDFGDQMQTDGDSIGCCADNINLDRLLEPTSSPQTERLTSRSVTFLDQRTQRDSSQHQLLTQCLSQLKLHQEAINKQHQQQQLVNNHNPTTDDKCSSSSVNSESAQRGNCSSSKQLTSCGYSDELLQLTQLNQTHKPLKPSAIKQNQQLHFPQSSNSSNLVQFAPTRLAQYNNNNSNQSNTSKLATISIDSIGSAGSFVHRNARSLQSSSSTTTSLSSSHTYCKSSKTSNDLTSSNCSSTCASSIEVGQLIKSQQQLAKQQIVVAEQTDDTIETFLSANGLADLSAVFASEKIDLEALVLLSEADLKSLNILLGPRRKLLKAIENLQSSKNQLPMYLMMDTQL